MNTKNILDQPVICDECFKNMKKDIFKSNDSKAIVFYCKNNQVFVACELNNKNIISWTSVSPVSYEYARKMIIVSHESARSNIGVTQDCVKH